MNIAMERKTKEIESRIRKGIVITGPKHVADACGVHQSQISRWQTEQTGFVTKAAKLLAAIGFEAPVSEVVIHGEETAQIAKALQEMLSHLRESASSAGTGEANQI
ncbi:lambda phage CII family protein [Photorhabdus temperata]|uniref:lambda phage CII family protein n=1 Tax=Photorhabdus temperata TaxID=574560 RepID=UPI0021D4F58C|nr:lambda phage CII family protein [Photorhabdus temperata]MCT8349884.1 lambda phage CII family protein [Photorhabdus temperata]